jgi:protein-S-isoprenylcysteine O-methyltransferase Ste14
MINSSQDIHKPSSATHYLVALVGFTCLLITLAFMKIYKPFHGDEIANALLLILAPFICMTLLDFFWQRVYLRKSTGLNFQQLTPSLKRFSIKYLGLLGTIAVISFLYWLFPEYEGSFYHYFKDWIKLILPAWLLLAIPYFYWVDSKMQNPSDGYMQMGLLITCQFSKLDVPSLTQHLLSWLIKAYFLPLMFTYMCINIHDFLNTNYSFDYFHHIYDFLYFFIFFIDVSFCSMGYLFSMRIFDNHIRSSDSTTTGWIVALFCYEPFWSFFQRNYLSYYNDISWGEWLSDEPIMYIIWGSLILICLFVYVWSTVMFGSRFSNLTHRGIITSGPYRFSKHPAYISKNISWWLISIPFMADKPWDINLKHCLMLLALNFIYFLRAKTEERHLSWDLEYQKYSQWVDQYGLFSGFNDLTRSVKI